MSKRLWYWHVSFISDWIGKPVSIYIEIKVVYCPLPPFLYRRMRFVKHTGCLGASSVHR